MPIRFTISALFLATAIAAAAAAVVRIGGFSLAFLVLLVLGGICLLIRSDGASTVEDRVVLILLGLGLLAAAALIFLMPVVH